MSRGITPSKNHVLIQLQLLRALRQRSMFFELCRKAPRSVTGAHYEMNILVNKKFTVLFSTISFLMHKNFSIEVNPVKKSNVIFYWSINKHCCLLFRKRMALYWYCHYCSTFEIQGDFFVFLLIDEQRNVLYVEFKSAEKYTSLLQNTCSFPIDKSTRQLHINFWYISLSVFKCTVCSYNTVSFMLKLNNKHWLYKSIR